MTSWEGGHFFIYNEQFYGDILSGCITYTLLDGFSPSCEHCKKISVGNSVLPGRGGGVLSF